MTEKEVARISEAPRLLPVMVEPPSYIVVDEENAVKEPIVVPGFPEKEGSIKLPGTVKVGSIICMRRLSANPEEVFKFWKIVPGEKATGKPVQCFYAEPLEKGTDAYRLETVAKKEMGFKPKDELTLPPYNPEKNYYMEDNTFFQLVKGQPSQVEVGILTPEALEQVRKRPEYNKLKTAA